ncbi:major facilitator superfamily (MFS), general substrate transporter [Roseivivax marinus]|uniref:Major facilitator superfamily (MFS), general substrate transporter n=1 Tax=Roseivivax marinus TaxID=1379903 RepID=W4HH07_9RHOB|nr:major facilitator superfamily (MFS), general substrate transporter [Roseivivax marinus]
MILRSLASVAALLLGSAFLLFAGGMHGLLLPIRGEIEGFTAASLGLLGTGWALGYVAGCVATPRLVARVGHIRAFGAMCALAAITVLVSLLLVSPWVWTPMRGLSGFCFAGAAMIVESWLSERAGRQARGRIFGIYTMVNLAATTAGQFSLAFGDPSGFAFFVVAAIFYCLALLPTAVSATASPTALTSVSLDLPGLWRNSPIAVFSVLMVGMSNGAFGALSAVYAARLGLDLQQVALFASVPLLAGAVAQVPVGELSDRFDRRLVLIGVALIGLGADAVFITGAVSDPTTVLIVAAVFGAAVFSMYPTIVAHANDHAPEGSGLQVSGGLLFVFGIGSIIGPTAAGFAMNGIGPESLFWTTGAGHLALILFAIVRLRARAGVARADKTDFTPIPLPRSATPETSALARRGRRATA